MEIRLLGPVTVVGDRGPIDLGGRKQRSLLALLAAHAPAVVSVDRCVQALWGDEPPDGATHTLQTYVSNLRRLLGDPARIVGSDGGYRLVPAEGWKIDVAELEKASADADLDALARMVGDGNVDPLGDLADEAWARPYVTRWSELRRQAFLQLADARLEEGEAETLIVELEEAVDAEPLHEPTWARYVLALYRAGRQVDALRAFGRLRDLLGEELGIEPSPELVELEERILLQDPSLLPPVRTPTNLPAPLVDLVGRTTELETVAAIVDEKRLVTITGSPGCGKTTLALEVARRRLAEHTDGVWWFELTPFTETGPLLAEMLGAMGVSIRPGSDPLETLVAALRGQRMLVVLDGCERLVDEVASLAVSILQAVPEIKVLTTSRRPLGVSGEMTWELSPLPVPDEGVGLEEIRGAKSVQLFERRAQAADRHFALTDANAQVVASICRHLDGLPLAIELAAARVRSLGVAEVERRLTERFRVLVDSDPTRVSHHQTLRAAVEWSTQLLTSEELALHRRLSVFPGHFDLAAAEAVGGDDAVERIDELVRHSLLPTEPIPGGGRRYRMLETVREHARRLLQEAGEEDKTMAALLGWVAELTWEGAPQLLGPQQSEWLRRFRDEADTIRTALGWAVEHDPATGVAVASEMARFWSLHATDTPQSAPDTTSFLVEGRSWIQQLLDAASPDLPDELRGRALAALGGLLEMRIGLLDEAIQHLDEAVELLGNTDDVSSLGWATLFRAITGFRLDDPDDTIARFERALELHAEAEDPLGMAFSTFVVGAVLAVMEGPAQGRPYLEKFAAGAYNRGVPLMVPHADLGLVLVSVLEGDASAEVRRRAASAIRGFREIGNLPCLAMTVQLAAALETVEGQYEDAARFLGMAAGIHDRLSIIPAAVEDFTPTIERLGLASLDPQVRVRAFAEGRSVPPDEAIELALSAVEPTEA